MGDAKPLAGKVALITGAGRGLGRAFAERLGAMGADLVIHGRRGAFTAMCPPWAQRLGCLKEVGLRISAQYSAIQYCIMPLECSELGPAEFGEGISLTATAKEIGDKFGVQSLRVLADLSIAEDVDRIVAEIMAQYGRIDILVHNAGGDIAANGGKADPNDAVMIKDEDVLSIMNNNLQSSILICQRVARVMIPQHEGRIILVSSVAGLAVSPGGNQTMYAVAKAGVNKYTKMLAGQLLEHNINVNCIAPGATKSGRFVATVKDGTQGAAFKDPQFRERFLAQMDKEENNIGRPGSVDEVARVVDFFAGPLGSFVSGEVLKVDGGVARL